jgi:DNA-directed RNA polymerase subunit RPC12/RpoP
MKEIERKSLITCPDCGFQKEGIMPEDNCQFFYKCTDCKNHFKTEGRRLLCFL